LTRVKRRPPEGRNVDAGMMKILTGIAIALAVLGSLVALGSYLMFAFLALS
jgi:hypothetical protein